MREKTPEELEFERCNDILRELSDGEQLGYVMGDLLTKIIMRSEAEKSELQEKISDLHRALSDLWDKVHEHSKWLP